MSYFSIVNYNDITPYLKSVNNWFCFKNNHYDSIRIKDIYILFRKVPKTLTNISLYEEPNFYPVNLLAEGAEITQSNNKLKFPSTVDLWNWSKDIIFNNNYTFASYTNSENNLQFKFKIYNNNYKCEVISIIDKKKNYSIHRYLI